MTRTRRKATAKSLFTPLRLALAIGLAFCALRFDNARFLYLSDIRANDYRMLQRGPTEPSGEVVIVAIDDASVAAIGRWPWPRSVFAALLDRITESGPRAIGIDVTFSETSAFPDSDLVRAQPPGVDDATWARTQATLAAQDATLAASLRRSQQTVLGYYFDQLSTHGLEMSADASLEPLPRTATRFVVLEAPGGDAGLRHLMHAEAVQASIAEFSEAATAMAYFNVRPDPGDGLVRRLPLAIRHGEDVAMPLALETVKRARDSAAAHVRVDPYGVVSLSVAGTEVPVAEDGSFLIRYRGPAYTFRHIPAVALLGDSDLAASLRDKVVFIGVTAVAVADFRATPFSAVFPGVEIHANIADNILRGDFLYQPRWLVVVDIAVLLVLAFAMGIGLRRLRGIAGLLFSVALLVLYAVGSQAAYVRLGLPMSVVYPMLSVFFSYTAIVLTQYVTEVRERLRLRRVMDLYLSPTMAEHVSAHPERLSLGGEKIELTVFFSDIRGFTSISEAISPEALVELLNHYLGAMTEIIFAREGMLDKYIGDAVMAVWGAPLPQPDHARRACLAALEMVDRLEAVNRHGSERGWPRLEMGCGLNTGPMVFGNMGSEQHLALTVMGDNVNLASRLEGANKVYGTKVLASAATVAAAGDAVVAREIELLRVKGRREPVAVFEILGRGAERAQWMALLEPFDAGIAAYRARRWEAADEAFAAVLALRPEDGPAALYRDRCRAYRADPPGDDWDPVITSTSK